MKIVSRFEADRHESLKSLIQASLAYKVNRRDTAAEHIIKLTRELSDKWNSMSKFARWFGLGGIDELINDIDNQKYYKRVLDNQIKKLDLWLKMTAYKSELVFDDDEVRIITARVS